MMCLVSDIQPAKLVVATMPRVWVITGTDTGVGKTVLTALLTRFLRAQGHQVRAVKPFCSGSRDDAEVLLRAQAGELSLDEVNPWYFRLPVAPLVAARGERRRVTLAQTVRFLRAAAKQSDLLLIEGAGGLLSPLGEGFCLREVITALRAIPLVVCSNRLGAINQARLVFAALPPGPAARAHLVLVDQARPDESSRTNQQVLASNFGSGRVHRVPWLPTGAPASLSTGLTRRLRYLLGDLFRTFN
ncbi:MAG TPA: dethiobiotin synthase [Verrucomicrobiota bacterium]|nr:dethiobiotin synthase [Verrucomicrobiales bacterium]HRI13231.1 dethiobiotin synthase [Verrucomicrobiota bacterium]